MGMPKVISVILAAGRSVRLGFPKQLVSLGDKTLLERSLRVSLATKVDGTIVVVQRQNERIEHILQPLITEHPNRLFVSYNDHPERGISESIKNGLREAFAQFGEVSAILFSCCDQPFVTPAHLNDLIDRYTLGHNLVASTDGAYVGVPAIFGSKYFPEICNLMGDAGAKWILTRNMTDVERVHFAPASFDVDTVGDVQAMIHLAQTQKELVP